MFIQSNSIQTIKENIMTYFNGTLQEFTYLHEQVTEISNPDESYLGTLNLFFKEPVTSNDEQPNIIKGFVKNFIEDFKPDYYYEILVTDVEGYTPTFIEYYAWDEDEDGPIPGIKLFKDLNIYPEREYCEY